MVQALRRPTAAEVETFSVTPTVTNGAGYAANDVIGGRLRFSGWGERRLQSITIADKDAQAVDYWIVFFDETPTNIADSSTFDIADADVAKIRYDRDLTSASERKALSTNSFHRLYDLDMPLRSKEGDGSLWAFLVGTTAPTYSSTSAITVTLQGVPL